ncbi:MAG: hypothetical protein ACRCTE_12875 [Cellulosilyticaceae bacterium]
MMPYGFNLFSKLLVAYAISQQTNATPSDSSSQRFKPAGFIEITGTWDTSRGPASFETSTGSLAYGTFGGNKGKIFANYTGDGLLKGTWSQAPTYDCPNDKGPVELIFSKEGTTFTGKFGVCNGPLTQVWTGKKTSSTSSTSTTTPTPIVLPINPTGSWQVGEGILLLEGDTSVIGSYKGTELIGRHDNGIIQGTMAQSIDTNLPILIGTWSAPPTFECPGNKGQLELKFNPTNNGFTGNWSYCDGPMFAINQFIGTLIVGPNPLNVTGPWDTNLGPLMLTLTGNTVTGTFTNAKIKLTGKIIGNVYIGRWSSPNSYSCPYEAGTFRIVFTPNNTRFKGNWDYCAAPPDPAKVWEGVKV